MKKFLAVFALLGLLACSDGVTEPATEAMSTGENELRL